MRLITYWSRSSAHDLEPVLHGAFIDGRAEESALNAARQAAQTRAATFPGGDWAPAYVEKDYLGPDDEVDTWAAGLSGRDLPGEPHPSVWDETKGY